MKNNKGITLVSLVVTILVLIILSGVSVSVGTETVEMIKNKKFISELKVIQSKVDIISEETNNFDTYGFTKLTEVTTADRDLFCYMITSPTEYNIDTSNSWNNALDSDINNYYYFKDTDFEKIGLKNQKITCVINFKTRNVIVKNGLKVDDKIYYRQYDVSGGDKLIK